METRNEDLCTNLCGRYEKLKSSSLPWHDLYQQLSEYYATRLATVTVERFDADLLEEDLYEDVGKEAAEDFAAGCTNYIVPAGEKWARFDADDPDAPEIVKEYWARATEIVLGDMVASSFHLEAQEDFFMSGVYGLANMKVEEGKRYPYKFQMVNPGYYQFECDDEDTPDIVYQTFKRTTKQLVDQFGKEELHDNILSKVGKVDGVAESHEVLHVVMPRETYIEGLSVPQNRPYAEYWIDVKNKHLMSEGGFYENPYIISRMYKCSDSFRGYSIAMRCLPKVRQLSQMEEDKMIAQELLNDPPWLSPNDGAADFVNTPGGITYYDASLDPRHKPEQITLKNAVHHTREEIQQKRDEVRKSFFADMFQAFADQPKQMTATEVLAIMEQKLVLFTPFFTRYTKEKLNRVLERCLKIGIRNGRVPAPPQEVLLRGGNFKIEYSSRVALAIKLMENKNLLQLLDMVIPLSQVDPTVLKVVKLRESVRRFADNLAIDPDLLTSEDDIMDEINEERALQGAMASAEIGDKAASAVGKLPPEMQRQLVA